MHLKVIIQYLVQRLPCQIRYFSTAWIEEVQSGLKVGGKKATVVYKLAITYDPNNLCS